MTEPFHFIARDAAGRFSGVLCGDWLAAGFRFADPADLPLTKRICSVCLARYENVAGLLV